MDFEISKEQKLIQKSIREFMLKEFAPNLEKIDMEDQMPANSWKLLAGIGLLGLSIDEEYGGSGMDIFSFALSVEQVARVSPALSMNLVAHSNLCAHNLERNANEEQKKKYLPGLCNGDLIGCLALTEPNAGSDAVGIETTADEDGDSYILNGSKMFITNGPEADIALTYAKTDVSKGAKGITAFIVEKDFPGFSVSKKLKKMGIRGSKTGELIFHDCRVPKENIVGEVNNGVRIMMNGLDVERVVVAAACLGMGEAAVEIGLDYAKNRMQFGKPIADFQLIKAKLADMYTEMEAARGLVYRSAILADQSLRGGKGTELHKLAAAAVLFTAEAASRAANQSLQIHGGYGYTLEYPINMIFRDTRLFEIGAGTSEIRRLLIADELINRGCKYI